MFKNKSIYKKSIIIFTSLLLIISISILLYVYGSLRLFERCNIDNYLNKLTMDIKKAGKNGSIESFFEIPNINSKYETESSLVIGYKELLEDAKITYKKRDKEDNYDIYADNLLIATASLDGSDIKHRLGLLTFSDWKVKSLTAYNENGLYEVEAYVNSYYNLYINGIKVENSELLESGKIKQYAEVYDKVDLPKVDHYKISNLTRKPKVEIKDKDGKVVKYKYKNGIYYFTNFYETDDYLVAKKYFKYEYDPTTFVKNWSLYLTDDLSGTRHGFYKLAPNLIEGTDMYKKAYRWATNADIRYTSGHRLDKETFTNVKMNNFIIYGENAFSVEVYLEKNMTLITREKRKDTLHEIIYFAYYDGEYRVIYMKTVL